MAKKKSSKASQEKAASSLKEALGIDKIFHNERINFVLGFCLLFIAGYLIWAFSSFFVTGEADQSIIEAPREGELLNQNGEFQNACGSMGSYASWFFIKRCFGLSAFFIPIFLILVSVNMMRAYKVNLLKWFMCLAILMVWASITMAKFLAPFFDNACFNPGGDHGLAVCQQIEGLIGTPGLTAVLALTAIAFLVYLSMETVIILRKIFNPLHYLKKIPMEIHIGKGDSEDNASDAAGIQTLEDPTVFDDPHYPTLDLLKKYETDGKPFIDMDEQNANKNRIVDVLRNFGVEISSIKATVGPTITLYEITPAPGVRISKIRNLEDDIALSLSALGIRIIAPIPGKGTIGIEVPNAKPAIVSMESILNSKKFQETTMDLPCALGKTITNEVFMFDLAKAPHLLVAGATGQGKSVGLNAILTSLLYKKHPAELKIVLVDPKKVEFSIYATIEKHFLAHRRHQGGAHAELAVQGDGYPLRPAEDGPGAQY